MKRILPACLFGVALAATSSGTAAAQDPGCGYGYGAGVRPYSAGCQAYGCGGFCFRFLGKIHQHGPLYNYGPYSGYYPFEPYGPWSAQLQYTGPTGDYGCGWRGLCNGKCGGTCGYGRLRGGSGCDSGHCDAGAWNSYAGGMLRNIFHRTHPRCDKARCGSCGDI